MPKQYASNTYHKYMYSQNVASDFVLSCTRMQVGLCSGRVESIPIT